MYILKKLLEVIAPAACVQCGAEGPLLCSWCTFDAFSPVPSRCYRCQKLTRESAACTSCRRRTPLKHVWVTTMYEKTAQQLVKAMKFNPDRSATAILADKVSDTLPYFVPSSLLIIPVPTASVRVRQRGFDHAKCIAKLVAQNHKQSYYGGLKRLGNSRQVGAKRKERLSQLEGAFWVINPRLVKGRKVLLVDDVLTTGASIESAARSLKKAGAKEVNAVVFAQTL